MFEKYVLTNEEAANDVSVLCSLAQSICNNGRIHAENENGSGWDSISPCRADQSRVAGLGKLMDKYSYGWYIAQSRTSEEQLKDINEFSLYILSHIGQKVCDKESA